MADVSRVCSQYITASALRDWPRSSLRRFVCGNGH